MNKWFIGLGIVIASLGALGLGYVLWLGYNHSHNTAEMLFYAVFTLNLGIFLIGILTQQEMIRKSKLSQDGEVSSDTLPVHGATR